MGPRTLSLAICTAAASTRMCTCRGLAGQQQLQERLETRRKQAQPRTHSKSICFGRMILRRYKGRALRGEALRLPPFAFVVGNIPNQLGMGWSHQPPDIFSCVLRTSVAAKACVTPPYLATLPSAPTGPNLSDKLTTLQTATFVTVLIVCWLVSACKHNTP